jgi:hypothetical protein
VRKIVVAKFQDFGFSCVGLRFWPDKQSHCNYVFIYLNVWPRKECSHMSQYFTKKRADKEGDEGHVYI